MVFLSLNSGGNPESRLENLENMLAKGSFLVDDGLQTQIATTNDCLGLIIHKHEITKKLTATLTSWDCSRTTSLICSLDASQFTAPQMPVKFPCLPQTLLARVKRQSDDEEMYSTEEYEKGNFLFSVQQTYQFTNSIRYKYTWICKY